MLKCGAEHGSERSLFCLCHFKTCILCARAPRNCMQDQPLSELRLSRTSSLPRRLGGELALLRPPDATAM